MNSRLKGYDRCFGGPAEAADDFCEDGQAFFMFGDMVLVCEYGSELQERLEAFSDSLVEMADQWFAYAEGCVAAKRRGKGETCSDAEAAAASSKASDAIENLLAIGFPHQIANLLAQFAFEVRDRAQCAGREKAMSEVHLWN